MSRHRIISSARCQRCNSQLPTSPSSYATTTRRSRVLHRTPGVPDFLFLQTDDFWRDYRRYVEAGVEFTRAPSEEPYGTVAVFQDLYGNRWDLLQYDEPTR